MTREEMREKCEKLSKVICDGGHYSYIEQFAREIRNEALEEVYQLAKKDELELISAKEIRALKDIP